MGAAPIWHDVMETLHKGRPVREFAEPPGMVRMEVCADSGLPPINDGRLEDRKTGRLGGRIDEPASQSTNLPIYQSTNQPTIQPCPRTIIELFIEGTQPTRTDDWHWSFALDMRNGLLAGSDCPLQFTTRRLYTLYPAEAQDWVRKQAIPQPPEGYSPLCPDEPTTHDDSLTMEGWKGERSEDWKVGPVSASHSSNLPSFQLILTSPDQGSRYRLSQEIPEELQQVAVAVRPVDGIALDQVTLLANGRRLATLTHAPYQILWPMTVGTHVFTAVGKDAQGNTLKANDVIIEVIQ
jgi:hypothetical protein